MTVAPVFRAMYGMSIVWLKCECECRMKSARVTRASTAAVSETRSSPIANAWRVSPGTSGVSMVPKRPRYRRRERYGSSRMTRWPSVISHPAAPRCVSRTGAPTERRARVTRRARAMAAASAAGAARAGAASDLALLGQLHARGVPRPHEADPGAVGILDRPFQQASAQALEPLDVGLEMGRVEPEVLETVMGA